MPIIRLDDIPKEPFPGGATYQTIVGDESVSTPVRVGLQISPPGYSTGTHSHPDMEIVSVIEGEGDTWIEGRRGAVAIDTGTTLVLPPGIKHGFRATGSEPLKTYGVHASPDRIVDFEPGGEGAA